MAVSKLPLSPYRQDTRVFPTPLSSDVLFSELRDCTRSEIPAYGTAHPDSRKWPDHKLVFVKQVGADQREGLFEFYYAADRANQDLYNFSTGFDNIGGRAGDRNFRIITRVYLTPRAEYNPVDIPFGTAMPDAPKGMFEVGEYIYFDKQQQKADIEELNSLYVIEAHRYIEKAVIEEITSFDKERSDVIPEKFRVGYPTLRTDRIVEGIAEEPTLDSNDLAVSEKQVNPDVKLVTNVSRDGLTDTITLSGSRAYAESTDASVTETLTTDGSIEKGLFVIESQSTPLGDGNFVVQTVKVDQWPELTRSEWDPILNSPVLTTRTFVGPPTEQELNTPFTTFEPVNEDRYLKQTEQPPTSGLAAYRFSFPSRVSLDLPAVLRRVQPIYNSSQSTGNSTSNGTSDTLSSSGSSGNVAYSLSSGGSTNSSSSSMPEFIIETERVWGRDLKADNHVFFLQKGDESGLSNVRITEEEILFALQSKFYSGVVDHFDANPSTIRSGQSTVLSWNAPAAEVVRLDTGSGFVTVPKVGSSAALSPTVDTVYTLETTNNDITETRQLKVSVAPNTETLIQKFDVSNSVAKAGDKLSLTFDLGSIAGSLLHLPNHMAVDSSDNIYVSDLYNHAVYKIPASTGNAVILAGTGVAGYTSTKFNSPAGMCVDSSGNVYVADTNNQVIRKISSGGTITLIAGTPESAGFVDNANPLAAKFKSPRDVALDSSNNLYVLDFGNHVVRKIAPSGGVIGAGAVTTFCGSSTGEAGYVNSTIASVVRFNAPYSMDIDSSDSLYIADRLNKKIRKIETSSGSFVQTTTAVGLVDNTGGSLRFTRPSGSITYSGDVYSVDTANHTIKKNGVVIAGASGVSGTTNGSPLSARFNLPTDIILDSNFNLYIVDSGNNSIRKLATSGGSGGIGLGSVTQLAGSPTGLAGYLDGNFPSILFRNPQRIDIDGSDNLYVDDRGNNKVRKVLTSGTTTTETPVAGSGGSLTGPVASVSITDYTNYVFVKGSDVYYTQEDSPYVYRLSGSTVDAPVNIYSIVSGRNPVCLDSSNNVYVSRFWTVYKYAQPTYSTRTVFAGSEEYYGFQGGVAGLDTVASITCSDPEFSFLLDGDPNKDLPLWAQNTPNEGIDVINTKSLDINIYRSASFTLTVTSGATTESRTLDVYVYENSQKLAPWPVFKTSSGRAVAVGRSMSKSNSFSKSQSDAVSESSVFRARNWTSSYSYSTDTKVSVTEIANVLTVGIGSGNVSSVAALTVNNTVENDPFNARATSVTHRDQAAVASTTVSIPRSHPTNIPRNGFYLLDYKIEYYKWGWFRCVATVFDASQFR